jgi:hypothetical protein
LKVFQDDEEYGRRMVGRADVPADTGAAYEVRMFGATSVITERFMIGTVTHFPKDGGLPVEERAVLAASGQPVELLPGWMPLRPDRGEE